MCACPHEPPQANNDRAMQPAKSFLVGIAGLTLSVVAVSLESALLEGFNLHSVLHQAPLFPAASPNSSCMWGLPTLAPNADCAEAMLAPAAGRRGAQCPGRRCGAVHQGHPVRRVQQARYAAESACRAGAAAGLLRFLLQALCQAPQVCGHMCNTPV